MSRKFYEFYFLLLGLNILFIILIIIFSKSNLGFLDLIHLISPI